MSQPAQTQFTRNKRIATGMLVGMTFVFVGTLFVDEPSNWVLLARAMAEAGMIGGLADWFAVEALFRHPLRIPIPHTALLPRSKNRIARNIGDFITQHFLKPKLIRKQLQEANVAEGLKNWLLSPGNAQLISNKAAAVIKANLQETGASAAPIFVKNMLRDILMRPQREIFIGQLISRVMASNLRAEMIDYALQAIRNLVDESRDSITGVVQERSRWWIASSADRRLSRLLVDEMVKMIDELLDHRSPLRRSFDEALTGFANDPERSANISRTVQTLLIHLVESDEFEDIAATFIRGLKRALDDDLGGDGPTQTIAFIETMLTSIALKLEANPQDLAALNIELSEAAGEFANQLSNTASNFITNTIQQWDENEMVALFEEQVGSDLQFIRMNGTILGAGIGGVLFGLSYLIEG